MIILYDYFKKTSRFDRNRFESFMKPQKAKMLIPNRYKFESNMFESFMSTLLKILFPSNQNVCIKQQLF